MDKEALQKKLQEEGYPFVYEWHDEPGFVYEPHEHQDKVTLYITAGGLVFDFNGEKKELKAGNRFDVPPQTKHSAVVGPEGCDYFVGAMNEED